MDKKWLISISLKFVLIFFLPLYLVTGPSPAYSSPLLNLGSASMTPLNPMQLSSIPLVLTFVVVLAVPAVMFDYIAKHRPVEEPIGKLFVLVYALMTPYGQSLLLLPVYIILLIAGGGSTGIYGTASYSISIAVYADTWTMALMVVIPFFMREIRVLNRRRSSTDTASGLDFSSVLPKYDLLAIAFSVCLFLMPIAIISEVIQSFQNIQQQMYMVSGGGVFQAYPTGDYITLIFNTVALSSSPFLYLATALNTVYIDEVLRYLKGKASRTKCLGAGLLATGTIPFTVSMPYQSFGLNITVMVYPLPTILALGLLVVWRIKPTEVSERIWRDEQDHIWYKHEGPMVEGEKVERIKVPLLYTLRSKLGRTERKKTQYDRNHKEEDAFDDESDAKEQ